MVAWMMERVWWFAWRLAVSGVCLWTIQNVIHQEGYYVETKTLLVAGACAILGIRIWMPSAKQPKSLEEK
jgi:hypothetical protein